MAREAVNAERRASELTADSPHAHRLRMSSTDLSARFLSYLAEVAQATEARLRAQVDGVRATPRARPRSPETRSGVRSGSRSRGGKRLRPALVGLGYRVAGGRTPDAVHGAFAAVELLHASYLVHDDIADGDRLRRGGPALHVELEALTETVRDAESSAILAGDWLAGLAFAEMASCPVEAVGLVGAVRELADQVLRVNVGQLDDVRSTGVSGRDELERMYENKTASYSTRGPYGSAPSPPAPRPRASTRSARSACRSGSRSSSPTTALGGSATRP